MKKLFFLILFLSFTSTLTKAEMSVGEYLNSGDVRISKAVDKTQAQVHFEYNVAKNGGSQTFHNLGVKLPAKAVIVRSYFQISQPFTSASLAGSVALSCETANNIKTATDLTGEADNAFVNGETTGAISTFKQITNECEIRATVSNYAMTAGGLKGWVQYIIGKQ